MSSQERMPLVSVVVPTRNRAAHLRVLLAALEAQDYPRHEVVVVDDASTDGTVSVLAAWEQEGKVVLRQRASGGGYAARNRGWKAARGEIIAFTDDDCVPQPGWLPALVAAFWGDPEIIGVQGRTMVGAGEVTPFTHQIEQLHGGPPYRTCNIAYRRSMLEQVGGFRDDLRWYADNILGLDALRLGKLAFAPEAVVHHPPRARDWRNRNDWIARFSADAEHRRHLQRHGLEPAIPVRALPVVLWMVRPLLKQSASHVRFALAHPARYLDELRPMMAEKRALLSAIRNRDSLAGSATLEPRGLPALPDQPLVSVLIVTRDRAGALESLLQELKSQTWTRREVVVIEHGSDRSIESLVARHGARYGYCRPGGLGSARQEAVRLAAGEIVAFIDDDCVPAHDWLEGAVNAFREHPQAWGVQGRTLAERGPAGAHTIRVEAPDALYRTCNIAYRRDAIRAAGGFDERFVGWFEDTALGARISRHGEIVWQPDMVVTHAAMPRIPMDRRRWRILLNDERNLARYYRGFYWRTRCPGFTATVLSRWLIGSPLKSAVRELPRARSDPAGYMRLVLLLVRERAALLHVLANMVRRSSEGDGTEREPSPPAVID